MLKALRDRLTYANVTVTLALFIALGGSSYAALQITGKQVRNHSLTGRESPATADPAALPASESLPPRSPRCLPSVAFCPGPPTRAMPTAKGRVAPLRSRSRQSTCRSTDE